MPGSSSRGGEGVLPGSRRPSAPAALSPAAVEHLLGYLLALAEVPTSRAFRQHVGEPFGLRPVEFTLLMLLQTNRRASATQIRHALRMPAPHVTTLVDRLAERGLVQRGRDPLDGRAVRITLSAAGTLLAARLQVVAQHMEDGLHDALTAAERNQLRRLLKKLATAGSAG
jgi:DNA-binding MarR family transcriptional regulator